jgi:hypothetical protein
MVNASLVWTTGSSPSAGGLILILLLAVVPLAMAAILVPLAAVSAGALLLSAVVVRVVTTAQAARHLIGVFSRRIDSRGCGDLTASAHGGELEPAVLRFTHDLRREKVCATCVSLGGRHVGARSYLR